MANVIGMEQRSAILGLWRRKWSRRRIARSLGLNRRTVAGYIEQYEEQLRLKAAADSNCTIPPAGNGDAKPSIVPAGKSGRQSQCEPYSEQIELAMEKGLHAQRIWQDLVCDYT